MNELPDVVEEQVQGILRRMKSEPVTHHLSLTTEQYYWLGRAVHQFQAYEMSTPKNHRDKMFTEAMCRFILGEVKKDERTVKNES